MNKAERIKYERRLLNNERRKNDELTEEIAGVRTELGKINHRNRTIRADLEAVAVAGVKLMTYLDFIKLDCSETERQFHEDLARPGVQAVLKENKDG